MCKVFNKDFMTDKVTKQFPIASPEVAKMLQMDEAMESEKPEVSTGVSGGDLPVVDLPIVEVNPKEKPKKERESDNPDNKVGEGKRPIDLKIEAEKKFKENLGNFEEEGTEKKKSSLIVKFFKTALPYLGVFVVAVFLYYFFFSQVNFSSITKSVPKAETKKESAITSLVKQNSESYYKWISGFYFQVTDPKIIDPLADNSGNGLSNFQKYLLNLNPKSYDTLGNGMADSEALALGLNPLTGGEMTKKQKDIIENYINMEVVMNRFTLEQIRKSGSVAGIRTVSARGGLRSPNYNYSNVPLSNPVVAGDQIEIDKSIPGRLEIPSLDIEVPIIWTKESKDFDADLKRGVVHYPGTALPGQIGTSYISGHSSNYFWADGDYNKIFSKLGDLADNASFKITVVQKNGRDAVFHYVVTHRKVFTPTDQEQFKNTGKSVIALSTCWPLNTTSKRLVVFAELTQVTK